MILIGKYNLGYLLKENSLLNIRRQDKGLKKSISYYLGIPKVNAYKHFSEGINFYQFKICVNSEV